MHVIVYSLQVFLIFLFIYLMISSVSGMISFLRWLISLALISFSSLPRTLMHFGGGCCSILVVLSLSAFGMICSSSEESSATCCTAKFEDDFSSTVDGGN